MKLYDEHVRKFDEKPKNDVGMKQKSRGDFKTLEHMLMRKRAFSYIRFSDGEIDIIRNRKVHIGKDLVQWDENILLHDYPIFDYKDFDPAKNQDIRSLLIESAKYYKNNFFKGIPTKHNNAVNDRNLMINFNNNKLDNLTFADLLINQNFLKFRKYFLPLFLEFSNVYYVGNFRANPKHISLKWAHIPVQDNFFLDFKNQLKSVVNEIEKTPPGSLILLSASSLSNIVALEIFPKRSDLTLIDIGTSIHDLVGLGSGIREYHKLLLSNTPLNFYRKLRYIFSEYYRLSW
jgi:hypothetical protein